jgi:hypothetical protein
MCWRSCVWLRRLYRTCRTSWTSTSGTTTISASPRHQSRATRIEAGTDIAGRCRTRRGGPGMVGGPNAQRLRWPLLLW